MPKLEEARDIYDQVVDNCVAAKNRGKKESKQMTREEWLVRTKSSALVIVREMEEQIQEEHFRRYRLAGLVRNYSKNFTGTNYGNCFGPIDAWPDGINVPEVIPEVREEVVVFRGLPPPPLLPLLPPPPPPPPPQWVVRYDANTRRYYYYNEALEDYETTWDPPEDIGQVDGDRPGDWEMRFWEESNKWYYYNRVTHKSTWIKPAVLNLDASGGLWSRAGADDLPIDQGTRYRETPLKENTSKDDFQIGQLTISRNAEARLSFAVARQTRKLQDGPWSDRKKNAPLLSRAVLDTWEGARQNVDAQTLREHLVLARKAVRKVRHLLPLAPFNNQPSLDPDGYAADYTGHVTSVGHGMMLVEAVSERLATEEENPDPFFLYAAVAAAACAVGGGVCTHLMSVTAGVLTTMVPANTEILLWFSHADHQFCVMSIEGGPWVLVDPWPLNANATPWEGHCYFAQPANDRTRAARAQWETEQNGRPSALEENYAKITVHTPCEAPYGIPGLLGRATAIFNEIHATVQPAPIGHPYRHEHSLAGGQGHFDGTRDLVAAAPGEWGDSCALD